MSSVGEPVIGSGAADDEGTLNSEEVRRAEPVTEGAARGRTWNIETTEAENACGGSK